MNRTDFQILSKLRIQEGRSLLDSGYYIGAYYLLGYSIECALKACIAKQTNKYDFPDKKLSTDAYTHDLQSLIKLAGLTTDFELEKNTNPQFSLNWAIVKDWSETSRYDSSITPAQARDMYSACSSRTNGILTWIKRKW